MNINFGSGKDIRNDFVNVDRTRQYGANVVWDMTEFPYPFNDNEADKIVCQDCLEHIPNSTKVINEFHRILKRGGELYIIVPHFSSFNAIYGDVHIVPFNLKFFDDFNANQRGIFRKALPNKLWTNDSTKKFNEVHYKICFYEKPSLFSLFNLHRRLQFLYEFFFSLFWRAKEIKIRMVK